MTAKIQSKKKRKRIFLFIHSTWDLSIECLDIFRKLFLPHLHPQERNKNNNIAKRNLSKKSHK